MTFGCYAYNAKTQLKVKLNYVLHNSFEPIWFAKQLRQKSFHKTSLGGKEATVADYH